MLCKCCHLANEASIHVAPVQDALKIYEYIKAEGPSYGLHIQQSKTKVWWPKMTSRLLNKFDCKVLQDDGGDTRTRSNPLRRGLWLSILHENSFFHTLRKIERHSSYLTRTRQLADSLPVTKILCIILSRLTPTPLLSTGAF